MTWFDSGLHSPHRGYLLQALEGDADQIHRAGTYYTSVGDQMESTADELQKLADAEKYRAQSLDEIRDSAREVIGDLRKASVRYRDTGPVLVTYAAELRTAQQHSVNPLVAQIEDAHARFQVAREANEDAQGDYRGLDRVMPWEDDPTASERAAARAAADAAAAQEASAAADLSELWTSFESGFSTWESAYETAADGVGDAIDASDIDDSWWEDLLDGVAAFASVVGVIAVIAAIVFGAPFALLIATVAGVVALAAHLAMKAAGSKRVSWATIAIDAIAIVPFLGAFGKGLRAGQGTMASLRTASGLGSASRSTVPAARNALVGDLRTIRGAGGAYGGQANRALRAPGIADDFLRGTQSGWTRHTWNAIRSGGTRWDGQALTISERMATAWPTTGVPRMRAMNYMAAHGAPGLPTQVGNVWGLTEGVWSNGARLLPGMPTPDDLLEELPVVGERLAR